MAMLNNQMVVEQASQLGGHAAAFLLDRLPKQPLLVRLAAAWYQWPLSRPWVSRCQQPCYHFFWGKKGRFQMVPDGSRWFQGDPGIRAEEN